MFKARWRIRKTTQPLSMNRTLHEYRVQWGYPLIPFVWVDSSAHTDEEKARWTMRERQFETAHPKKVAYFYKADEIPNYLPDEQKDRFCRAKENSPKLKALKYLEKILSKGK